MLHCRQPFAEQGLDRQKQRTSRKWLRLNSKGHTSVLHADKLQIAEQTGIQVPPFPPSFVGFSIDTERFRLSRDPTIFCSCSRAIFK